MLSFRTSSRVEESYPLACEKISREYEGCECDFALASGTVVAKIFDDGVGYMLTYPVPVCSDFSIEAALGEITDFCVREGIPEVITGVAACDLPTLLRGARHAELHALDERAESFVVEVKTALSMLDTDIDFEYEGLRLSTPSAELSDSYAALVRDREHSRYYGYEVTDDIGDASPPLMIAELRREMDAHITLTLFVTHGGRFIGEGVIYAADGRGSAEISFRVAREHTRRGFGRKILRALISLSEDIGLLRLMARVHRENAPSLSLLSSEGFLAVREDGELVYFEKSLV